MNCFLPLLLSPVMSLTAHFLPSLLWVLPFMTFYGQWALEEALVVTPPYKQGRQGCPRSPGGQHFPVKLPLSGSNGRGSPRYLSSILWGSCGSSSKPTSNTAGWPRPEANVFCLALRNGEKTRVLKVLLSSGALYWLGELLMWLSYLRTWKHFVSLEVANKVVHGGARAIHNSG